MPTTSIADHAARLREAFARARHAVVFTGAGISTESGIPDYRSPGGVWDRFRPIDFDEFLSSDAARREFWRRKFATHPTIAAAEPNAGHRAIALLVRARAVRRVITQNVDGLHQRSGLTDEEVVELHGNTTYAVCLDCSSRVELEAVRAGFERDERPPTCASCGGLVKTATISFGQPMPEGPMRRAAEAVRSCDLFVAVGTSLKVYPAAGFPLTAKRNGARLVILNREATPLDGFADHVIHAEIGPLLAAVAGLN